jgi:hypothetical protein
MLRGSGLFSEDEMRMPTPQIGSTLRVWRREQLEERIMEFREAKAEEVKILPRQQRN